MKTSAIRILRQKLAAGTPVFGLWITLEAPSITEMAVALGLDWVVIDAEHGHLDWKHIVEHLRATVRSDTVALVRVAELNGGLIKRALDLGADGVVVPWIESAEQLSRAVSWARYPLEGMRGIGAERATAWGQALVEHTAEANEHVLVVPIIETVRTASQVAQMCRTDGVELFFFGPADYSSTAGYRGQWEGPGVAEQILQLNETIRQAGKHCGVVATSNDNLRERLSQGFRFIALGIDSGMLLRSVRGSLELVGRDRGIRADLSTPHEWRQTKEASSAVARPTGKFRVALTGDFHDSEGHLCYQDIGLSLFDDTGVAIQRFAQHRPEIGADQLSGANGVIVLTPRVTAASLSNSADLLAIGRFGVGYDSVDVDACTAADVVLFIASGAVNRSVAEATVSWMLALSHQIRNKDKLVREARWDERNQFMGKELRERTLGLIGFGGIGRALVRLLSGFGMNTPLVFDPFVPAATTASCGARSVSLDELLAQADFVSIHCPLTDQTRNLIGRRELALMKRASYLINTARGGIVDENALYAALTEGRIAGAALDCFSNEPLRTPSRFSEFDNVLLAPHAIAWTDELFRDIGRCVCQGMLDLAGGKRPNGVVNAEVFDRPSFQAKWQRLLSNSPTGSNTCDGI
jgi:phosphoglycerate dehydrogenase-like enzyme/2-keto-3-deoxy-L-rhamnonate aldolase RhmA